MNDKARVTTCLFTTWFTQHFKSTVEIYCSEEKISFKLLLLLTMHLITQELCWRCTKFTFMSAKKKSILEPMNQGVILAFKS